MCTDIRAPCRRMPFIFPVGQEFLAYWVRIPSLLGRKNFSAGKFPYPFRSVQPGASSGVASSVQCPLLCVCICTQKQTHLSPIARYYIINKIMWNSVQLQYTDSLILDTGHWTLDALEPQTSKIHRANFCNANCQINRRLQFRPNAICNLFASKTVYIV